jgi:hypothetical protein
MSVIQRIIDVRILKCYNFLVKEDITLEIVGFRESQQRELGDIERLPRHMILKARGIFFNCFFFIRENLYDEASSEEELDFHERAVEE